MMQIDAKSTLSQAPVQMRYMALYQFDRLALASPVVVGWLAELGALVRRRAQEVAHDYKKPLPAQRQACQPPPPCLARFLSPPPS